MTRRISKLLIIILTMISITDLGPVKIPDIRVLEAEYMIPSESSGLSPEKTAAPDYQPDLPGDRTMLEYLVYLVNDLDAYWSPVMIDAGHSDPAVNHSFPALGEPVATNCPLEDPPDFPVQSFYCGFDDQIVVTQEMAKQVLEGTYKTNNDPIIEHSAGDFSVAFIVAHEYAHNLQTELGWMPIYEDEEPQATSRSLELNADCLAGVWAKSVDNRGLLETEDINEVLRTLADIGQDQSEPDPTHGSPEERTEAFMLGYTSGSAPSCDPYLLNAY